MFSKLRSPGGGGFSLLMVGLALLALAAFVPFPVVQIALVLTGLLVCVQWALGLRKAKYDLNRLWDEAPPAYEEPEHDTVLGDEADPYCGWCNEVYPAGTHRCTHCGRVLE